MAEWYTNNKKKMGLKFLYLITIPYGHRYFILDFFILPRCFECQNTLNIYSDIVLADPWLKEYVIKEKEGQTLFGSYTNRGQSIIMNAINNGYITAKSINENAFTSSQYNTIVRKNGYKNHPNIKKR